MNNTPTPNNWRPIETAPKDIPILGSDQFGVLSVLTWKDCSNSHLPRMAWSSHYDNEYMHHVESFPTHWQSLPEPPIPTPRTDDFTKTAYDTDIDDYVAYNKAVAFAPNLETELTAAREELAELKEEYGTWWAQKRIAIDELKEVTEQRDRLVEAIITHRAKAFPLTGEEFDQELWQALQSLNPDHTVAANDMIAAVKGGSDE